MGNRIWSTALVLVGLVGLTGCATLADVPEQLTYAVEGNHDVELDQLQVLADEVVRLEANMSEYYSQQIMNYEIELDAQSFIDDPVHPDITRSLRKERSDALKGFFLLRGYADTFDTALIIVASELSYPQSGVGRSFDNLFQDFGITDDSVRSMAKDLSDSFNAMRDLEYQLVYDSEFINESSAAKWHKALMAHKQRTAYFNVIIDSLINKSVNLGKDKLNPNDALNAIGSRLKDEFEPARFTP